MSQTFFARFADVVERAKVDPLRAASEFLTDLSGANPEVVQLLLGWAVKTEAEVDALVDNMKGDYLIEFKDGDQVWLCPTPPKEFDGHKPWLTVQGLRMLSIGVVKLLAEDPSPTGLPVKESPPPIAFEDNDWE